MKRHIFLSFFILLSFGALGQDGESMYIMWNKEVALKWSDFQAPPEEDTEFKALTNWEMSYDFKLSMSGGKIKTISNVYTKFDRSRSWAIDGGGSDQLLLHEQTHFDIAEWYARKLRSTLNDYQFKSENYQEELNGVFNDNLEACRLIQVQYDDETGHGLLLEKQNKWVARVSKELKKLEDWKFVQK